MGNGRGVDGATSLELKEATVAAVQYGRAHVYNCVQGRLRVTEKNRVKTIGYSKSSDKCE